MQWRDWAVSTLLHGALLVSVIWGTWHSKQHIAERLDIAIAWMDVPPVAIPVPPAPPVTPPKPQVSTRAPVTPVQQVPLQPLPPQTATVNSVVHADTVVTAAPAVVQTPPVTTATVMATPKAVPPAPVPAVNPAAQQARWHSQLEAMLLKHKQYPMVGRRMKQEGVVTVMASFSAQGDLLRSAINQSSGYKALDEAALHLVKFAADLARAGHQPGQIAEIKIPIVYELKD